MINSSEVDFIKEKTSFVILCKIKKEATTTQYLLLDIFLIR